MRSNPRRPPHPARREPPIQNIAETIRLLTRDPRVALYVAAMFLLVSIPMATLSKLVLDRQQQDIADTVSQAQALVYESDVRAVADALRIAGEGRAQNAPLDPDKRQAVEKAMNALDEFAYSAGRRFGTDEAMQKVDYAWSSVKASDGGSGQAEATLDALGTVGGIIANVARTQGGGSEPASSLIDAYGSAIPSTGARLGEMTRVAGSVHGEASSAAAHIKAAFRDVTLDLTRAGALDDGSNLAKPYAAAAAAIDQVVAYATDGSKNGPPRIAAAALAGTNLRTLAALSGEAAHAVLQERSDDQSTTMKWILFDTICAFAIGLFIAIMLARSIAETQARNLKHINEEAQRLRAERESDRMREQLAQSEARFAAVFDRASIGVAILNTEGRIVRKNAALGQLFPQASAHDVGARFPEFEHLIQGETTGFNYELDASENDVPRWLEVSVSLVRDEAGVANVALSIIKDITERREAEERLRREARYDPLLNLPNRQFLIEYMNDTLMNRRSVDRIAGVVFVNLGGFKVINDSVGHEIGDLVLLAAAKRLEELKGPLDFVSRYGGDEFVVVMDGKRDRDSLLDAADAVVRKLSEAFTVGGREIYINVHAGVAVVDRQYDNVNAILRDADTAMYHAKAQGQSSSAVFDASMRDTATRRLELAVQLRRAIERSQLSLVYQPVLRLETGLVASFEVLLRWEHPTLGEVPPSEFIPLAEEQGLINSLGRYVLDEACAQLARWRAESPAFDGKHIAVNASARELLRGDYCDMVEAAIKRHNLGPGDLVLEVTESTVLQSDRYAAGTLGRLKRAGVKLAIDDFGTGYSSLRYLRTFPFERLKIDASFVRGAGDGLASEPIVQLLLGLGRAFSVDVVAEGVETAEQARRLRELGCEFGQGYFFARPLAASEVHAMLDRPPAIPA